MHKRFDDPLEIILAYQKTKLRPVRRNYGDGVNCGCPAVVMAVAQGLTPESLNVRRAPIYDRCGQQVGSVEICRTTKFTDYLYENYGEDYTDGFMQGVDRPGTPPQGGLISSPDELSYKTREYNLGLQHGEAVQAVLPWSFANPTGRRP